MALDADTGTLRWHFQFTRKDSHGLGFDLMSRCCSMPKYAPPSVSLIANANRNAFYYVLDRISGEFVAGRPCAKQTWAGAGRSRLGHRHPRHRTERGGVAGLA